MPSARSLLLVVLAVATVTAQDPPQPSFRSDTSAVMVDVVVRDRKGNPVTDLTANDFEVLEDGVRQRIGHVTLVAPPSAEARATIGRATGTVTRDRLTAGGISQPGGARQSVAAIVFERLSPESRVPAMRAAIRYVDEIADAPETFTGVFLLDLALNVVHTFTPDREALRSSIEAVAGRATAFAAENRIGLGTGSKPSNIGAESRGAVWIWPADMQASALDDVAAAAQERGYDILQQSGASLAALKRLVLALGGLAGRKSIIYFSDGLPLYAPGVPGGGDELVVKFNDLIQLANRLNVAFYPVDAVGLRVHSQDAQNAEAIRQAVVNDLRAAEDPSGAGGGAALTLAQGVVNAGNTAHVFGRLARETGGVVIEGTNDLERGLAQIADDQRFHYILTYSPSNQAFGGEFRRISVRVVRPNMRVRARSGYVALRDPGITLLPSYEVRAVAALDTRPLPRQLPVRATALGLLSRGGEPRVAVVVSADASAVTFKPNAANDAFSTDFTILARIKDAQGAVVRKASEPYRLSGPIADLDRAHKGEILFFRQPELPPGSYMLEAAVHDAMASTAGARFVPFTVFEPSPHGMLVSSLVLVQRTERAGDVKPDDTNPLIAGDLLLYPRLGEPYKKSVDKAVSFFVRLKMPQAMAAPTATLVLLRKGQPAATLPLPLSAADAQGVIDHTAQLPLEPLPVGDFLLRLVVRSGGDEVVREVPFRVID